MIDLGLKMGNAFHKKRLNRGLFRNPQLAKCIIHGLERSRIWQHLRAFGLLPDEMRVLFGRSLVEKPHIVTL